MIAYALWHQVSSLISVMSRGEPSHAGQERASDAEYGLREACGVFGCVATDSWPTDLDVAHIVHLGLIGLQHRYQFYALFPNYNVCNMILIII